MPYESRRLNPAIDHQATSLQHSIQGIVLMFGFLIAAGALLYTMSGRGEPSPLT
jgi:hypothetical protein